MKRHKHHIFKLYLPVLLLFLTINAYTQNKTVNVDFNKTLSGKNLITQKELSGIDYQFPKKVYHLQVDTSLGIASIMLRNKDSITKRHKTKGLFIVYDLKNKKTLWSSKTNFNRNKIIQSGKHLIYSFVDKSYLIDIETGKEIWKKPMRVLAISDERGTGVGYKYLYPGLTNTLRGFSLSNGEPIWEKTLVKEPGVESVSFIGDTTLYIMASGLHYMNSETGIGWDYKAKTAMVHTEMNAGAILAGAAFGLIGGAIFIPYTSEFVTGLHSNILEDSCSIYFASVDKISRISKKNGEIMWSKSLPADQTRKSEIFIIKDLLYIVNFGFGWFSENLLDCGRPYFTALDKETGEEFFYNQKMISRLPALDYVLRGNNIAILFHNMLKLYSLENGELINENKIIPIDSLSLIKICDSTNYVKENERFVNLTERHKENLCIEKVNNDIIVLDQNMNIQETYVGENIFHLHIIFGGYKFIVNGNKTIILDADNVPVAEIPATKKAVLINKTLFDFDGAVLKEIDLSEVLTNPLP